MVLLPRLTANTEKIIESLVWVSTQDVNY